MLVSCQQTTLFPGSFLWWSKETRGKSLGAKLVSKLKILYNYKCILLHCCELKLGTLNHRDRGFDSGCGIITFIMMKIVSYRCTESRSWSPASRYSTVSSNRAEWTRNVDRLGWDYIPLYKAVLIDQTRFIVVDNPPPPIQRRKWFKRMTSTGGVRPGVRT